MSFLIRMSEALGRVLGWLASAWLLALLGVLLAALFIWYGGPLLTFNGHAPLAAEHWRWSAIALLVGVWGCALAGVPTLPGGPDACQAAAGAKGRPRS